jgi:hypothetical protein
MTAHRERRTALDVDLQAPRTGVSPRAAPRALSGAGARKWWAVALFTAVYLPLTLQRAWVKPLWEDELFTLALSRPPLAEIWKALSTGADQHPFPFYALTHLMLATSLPVEAAVRLPQVVAGWVAAMAVFLYLARVLDSHYGLLGMFCLMSTAAWGYATEARGYELMVAGIALAFLAWQAVGRRWGAAAGLALALMTAVSSHYFALLAVIPLAIAEASRTRSRGEVRGRVWIAFLAAAVPVLLSFPLIQASRSYAGTFWGKPSFQGVSDSYLLLLGSSVFCLAPLVALGSWATVADEPGSRRRIGKVPTEEFVALAGLLALPVISVGVTMLVVGAFAARYMLPATLGLAMLAAIALHGLYRGRATLALASSFVLAASLLYVASMTISLDRQERERQQGLTAWIEEGGDPRLPVLVAQPKAFLSLSRYAPAPLAGRLIFLGDTAQANYYMRQDTAERGFAALKRWFPPTILTYAELRSRDRRFLLLTDWGDFGIRNWALSKLLDDRARIQLLGRNRDVQLFMVELPNDSSAGRPPWPPNPAM